MPTRSVLLSPVRVVALVSAGLFLGAGPLRAQSRPPLGARVTVQLERAGADPMAPVDLPLDSLPLGVASWTDRVVTADAVGNQIGVQSGVWLEVRDAFRAAGDSLPTLQVRWRAGRDLVRDEGWQLAMLRATPQWQCLTPDGARLCVRLASPASERPPAGRE